MTRQGTIKGRLRERRDDLNETPACATEALIRVESLPPIVWEPAAGRGAIVQVLRAAGVDVVASDLVAYPGANPGITTGIDFLMEWRAPQGCSCMLTNPPFKLADAFAQHALTLCETVILFERFVWAEGSKREGLFRHLWRVWLGIERLPKMHREGWTGRRLDAETAPFAWFVLKAEPRPDGQDIALRRISWRGAA